MILCHFPYTKSNLSLEMFLQRVKEHNKRIMDARAKVKSPDTMRNEKEFLD